MSNGKSILYECQNLTLATGTGIATYARNLAHEAAKIGYQPSSLIGVPGAVGTKNSILEEVALFDARKRRKTPSKIALDTWRWAHSDIFGVSPKRFVPAGVVVDSDRLGMGFAGTYVVQDLVERARQHFIRYGSLLKVKTKGQFSALHTTQVIPLAADAGPTLCTIHDIIPLRLPWATLDNKRYFYNLVKAVTQRADHIVTVSEHSKRDLMEFFGVEESRITNTYQSVDVSRDLGALAEDRLAEDLENMFQLDYRGYFLFVGAIEPKKNVSRVIEAFATSGLKLPLILAGNLGWQYERDVERISDDQFVSFQIAENSIRKHKSVRHLSYLPRAQLIRLIKGARALIFPSLYEGFGLPVLEAMALGTPVITSNASSLPEVAGDAALLVDPSDSVAIAQALRKMSADGDLRAELSRRGIEQAKKFSPEVYQDRLNDLYRRVL